MKVQEGHIESTTAIAGMGRATSLTEAVGTMSPNHCSKPRDQSFRVHQPLVPFLFDFLGPEPFGFAFTEGQDAKFRVPSGHRFVIERVNLCCWAKDDHLDVEFVTTSWRTCRNLTSHQSVLQALPSKEGRAQSAEPIWVQGSSLTTLLFSNHELQGSPIVPPDTYVQIWGYLEPPDYAMGCQDKEDSMNPVQEKLAKRDPWTRSESLKYLALAICWLAMAVISTMSLNAQCPRGAGNDNWTRPGGGDWSNGGNWSLGVPYQRFNACIPARTGLVTVKPTNVGTGIFAAKNLTILGGTTKLNLVRPDRGDKKVELDLYGQTLTNQGGIQFLNAQGSTLSFKATNSDLSITGGGSLYLESPASSVDVGDGDVLTTDNTIFGRGNFGSPRAVLKNNGEFEADISGATLQIYAGQRKGQKDPWGVENDGAMIAFGGSALKVSVSGSAVSVGNIIANGPDAEMLLATGSPDDYFRNAGDISVRNGAPKELSKLTILTQKFDNNGSLDIGPFGTATIKGTVGSLATNSGIMNIAADGTLAFQTDGFQQTGGTTTVNGLLAIAHGAFLGGTLKGSGTVKGNIISTGATVKPGNSPGILTINGTYTQQGQGNFLVEIAGTAPGSGYGRLAVTENASLGGTLSVGLLGGFTPTSSDFFTILTAGDGLGGNFGNAPPVIAPNIGDITADGYNFDVIYNWSGTGPGSVVLANFTPVPVPEPASLLLFGSGVLALRKVVRKRR